MPINKPWSRFDPARTRNLPPNLGVYELGDTDGRVIYIGVAGGRSRFGLRGAIADHFGDAEPNPVIRDHAAAFRYEVNQMYLTRRRELLMRHAEAAGHPPDGNAAEPGAGR